MTRGLQANPRKAGDRKARSSTKSVVLTAGERMMGNLYTIRIAMVAAGHQHLACVKTMQQAVLPSSIAHGPCIRIKMGKITIAVCGLAGTHCH